jgi:hypothetical protein
MSNWIATNELRFVKRRVYDYNPEKGRVVHILQQKWVTTEWCVYSQEFVEDEEWRDVPVVEEE